MHSPHTTGASVTPRGAFLAQLYCWIDPAAMLAQRMPRLDRQLRRQPRQLLCQELSCALLLDASRARVYTLATLAWLAACSAADQWQMCTHRGLKCKFRRDSLPILKSDMGCTLRDEVQILSRHIAPPATTGMRCVALHTDELYGIMMLNFRLPPKNPHPDGAT
jgi:hypothetical protein